MILGKLVVGGEPIGLNNHGPVVGQLTQVLLHMKPEIHSETIEIFHQAKQSDAKTQKKLENVLKPRYIIEIRTECYGSKKKDVRKT